MSQTRIRIYQVDAFSSQVFAGNPAAICPLEEWLPAIKCKPSRAKTTYRKRRSSYGRRTAIVCAGSLLSSKWIMRTCDVGHRVHYFEPTDAIGELSSIPNQERHTGSKIARAIYFQWTFLPGRPLRPRRIRTDRSVRSQSEIVLAARDYLVVYAS